MTTGAIIAYSLAHATGWFLLGLGFTYAIVNLIEYIKG